MSESRDRLIYPVDFAVKFSRRPDNSLRIHEKEPATLTRRREEEEEGFRLHGGRLCLISPTSIGYQSLLAFSCFFYMYSIDYLLTCFNSLQVL